MDNIQQKILKCFLETLFPSFCLGCQSEGTYLCQDCRATLEISEHRYCLCSKDPLRLPPDSPKGKCSRCSDRKLSGIFSALAYQEKMLTRKLIGQFKYEPYLRGLAGIFSGILEEHISATQSGNEFTPGNSILVAVPLEKSKLKNRGYNQSEELAKELSVVLEIPHAPAVLSKRKRTQAQVGLSAKERQENIAGAFAVKDPEPIQNKKVWLVDDVYTTGSTMEEAARILKESGAKSVWGIAIAREG